MRPPHVCRQGQTPSDARRAGCDCGGSTHRQLGDPIRSGTFGLDTVTTERLEQVFRDQFPALERLVLHAEPASCSGQF